MTSGRPPRPTSCRDAVRQRLKEAALAMLQEGTPFRSISMAELSKRAGCSRTAFYFHFSGLDDLLAALIEDAATDIEARLAPGDVPALVDALERTRSSSSP